MVDWRGCGPRYDYVFVQGEPQAHGPNRSYFSETGLKLAELTCVFTLIDKIFDGEYTDQGRLKYRKVGHELALVEYLTVMNAGTPNQNNGMIEVRKHSELSELSGSGTARKRRVVPVSCIYRAAHFITTDLVKNGKYFINNYIDLEMYNTVY